MCKSRLRVGYFSKGYLFDDRYRVRSTAIRDRTGTRNLFCEPHRTSNVTLRSARRPKCHYHLRRQRLAVSSDRFGRLRCTGKTIVIRPGGKETRVSGLNSGVARAITSCNSDWPVHRRSGALNTWEAFFIQSRSADRQSRSQDVQGGFGNIFQGKTGSS